VVRKIFLPRSISRREEEEEEEEEEEVRARGRWGKGETANGF
jgi:hypothetical protein